MHAKRIVVLSKSFKFSLQIIGIPEDHMVKKFAAKGFDCCQLNTAVDTFAT